jgi:hypothetical protein
MRRTKKIDINLNKLKTGCSPCLNQAKLMQNEFIKRKPSEIESLEFKKIVSSLFKKD